VAENDASPPGGEVTDRRTKRRWPLIAGAVAILVAVILVLPFFSTLQPRYYERYDNLHGRMENWKASTHARVSCADCHMDPGVMGFITFGAKSFAGFYSQLIQGPKQSNVFEVPSARACQKCHTSYRRVSPGGDLLIPHKAHVQVLKINCAECHRNLVHSVNTKGYNQPEMSQCLAKCHNGVRATGQCTKCHTRKNVPESHKAKDWLEVHSERIATDDCGKCHAWQKDYCDECHKKRPKSHMGNWKKDHKVRAKERGKGCLVCHGGEEFCKKCHD
jgi:hypothetical protein